MIEGPINIIDIVVAGILLLSAIVAFFRGFVKEFLSLLGWIAAAVAALQLYPIGADYLGSLIARRELAELVAGAGIFIFALIVFSIVSSVIANAVKASQIGALDRSLGFAFGLLRGGALIAFAYLLFVQFQPREDHPPVLLDAKSYPFIVQGAGYLALLTPDTIAKALETAETVQERVTRSVTEGVTQHVINAPKPTGGNGTTEQGYGDAAREALADRIQQLQKQPEPNQ